MQTSIRSEAAGKRPIHAVMTLVIFGILLLAVFLISMNTGMIRLGPLDVVKTLLGFGTAKQELILFGFRLPRILIAVLAGAGLAVSGCILQAVSRNALADPGILGINAGAGLAVVLFISFVPATQTASVLLLPVLALLGAGAAAAAVYALAYSRHHGLAPARLVLVGTAVSAGIIAAMIVLTLRLDPQQYQFVAMWHAGSIWGTNWKFVMALLPWIVVLLPYAMFKARALNALSLGEQVAASLGVPVEKERFALLAAAVGLAAASVAVGGGIGFIGLIGPHLARRLVGPRCGVLLPASALAGGLLLLAADTLARWVIQPSELPAGIVVAVIGAPYFLYLLAKSKA